MKKVDLKKELRRLYNPSPKKAVNVDVSEMNFLMVDGKGDLNIAQEYKDVWIWTRMIMQPEYVTKNLVDKTVEQVRKKKNPSTLSEVRFESSHESLSAQIMHIGDPSLPKVQRLRDFITSL